MAKPKPQKPNRSNLYIVIVAVAVALLITIGLLLTNLPASQDAAIPEFPERYKVELNTMGDPFAPVRVDVWEDFQCPACARYSQETEPLIIETYVKTDKVYYTFHHFPFLDEQSETKESQNAANASMCAGEQGRFWDYHDTLFANWNGENEGAFSRDNLLSFGRQLNLDMVMFEQCLVDNRFYPQIKLDIQAGNVAGVYGTPSVFVNGELVTPGRIPSFADVSAAIEAALAK